MMQVITKPERKNWEVLLQRPYIDSIEAKSTASKILDEVKMHGDTALRRLSLQLDKVVLNHLQVSNEEINGAAAQLSNELKAAIHQAKNNIELFHRSQIKREDVIETMPGVQCWRKSVGIETVGLYIPGGTAPLFSTVLMLGIPASIAGCTNIVLCSPAGKDEKLHPAILYSASLIGIKHIYKIGGAQAIGAMAYGTESIPKVDKIFGPGNQYVTAAKQLVQQNGVAIDMPAGPSEVCVLADESAHPAFVAADLLSQAEHGVDSQVILITYSNNVVNAVLGEIEQQLKILARKKIATAALQNSKAIVVSTLDEAIEVANFYAAEHLIISCAEAEAIAEKITNAGSVFIGNYSPESVGDYASGTNHTLPTAGFANAYSGVSVDSFVKKITYQKLTVQGLKNIASTVINMATAEGLDAHANAVKVRLKEFGDRNQKI